MRPKDAFYLQTYPHERAILPISDHTELQTTVDGIHAICGNRLTWLNTAQQYAQVSAYSLQGAFWFKHQMAASSIPLAFPKAVTDRVAVCIEHLLSRRLPNSHLRLVAYDR